MSTYQDRAKLLFDKFYTDRKHEYDKFSRSEISVETFKANSKYLLDQALSELASIVEEEYFLGKFSYVDWETGDDDKLRVGDWIYANRQDHNGDDVAGFAGKIVRHYENNLPVFLHNIDPEDPDNSGDFVAIDDAWLRGYEFARIKEPFEQRDQLSNRRDN